MGIGGSDMYRQQILDHYKNPRNYGEISDATFSHTGENPICGDTIVMDVVLDDDEAVIERVAFRGDGCAISQASASSRTTSITMVSPHIGFSPVCENVASEISP